MNNQVRTLLVVFICVINTVFAADDCSFSYLPNKAHDTSIESLTSFKNQLTDQLGVELRLVTNQKLQKPKLTSKFLILDKSQYSKHGLRYLRSSVLQILSKRFYKVLDKEQEGKFNKLYEPLLILSGTLYEKQQNKNLGVFFKITPTHNGNGSSLNRIAGWSKKLTGSELIVTAKHIFETGSEGSYLNKQIYMNLEESIWGNFLEVGTFLHEHAHATFDIRKAKGFNSSFFTEVHYLEDQPELTYFEFLSFEEVYTFIFNIERSLYNLKQEAITSGKYLESNTLESVVDQLDINNEVFVENITLIRKYIKDLQKKIKSNSAKVSVDNYNFFKDGRNGFSIDLKLEDEQQLFYYDIFLENKINLKAVTKSNSSLNKFFKVELLKKLAEQELFFKEIFQKYQPIQKRIFALEENSIISDGEVFELHEVARELRAFIRNK